MKFYYTRTENPFCNIRKLAFFSSQELSNCLLPPLLGNTPTKKAGVSMDSKLIHDVLLELQINTLLKQIDYQLEYPIECQTRCSSNCKRCLYNVGGTIPICSKQSKQLYP